MNQLPRRNGDYGIDAPPVVRNLIIAGIASMIVGVGLKFILASVQSLIAAILLIWGLAAGASMLATAALMVWSSKIGKLRFREQLIELAGPARL